MNVRDLFRKFIADERGGAAVFTPVVNAFRFYNDDGGEAASTPRTAQDTNIVVNVAKGDDFLHLRLRVDETGGKDGATTDEYALQRNNNELGWLNVPVVTAGVYMHAASQLVEAGSTTDRTADPISNPAGAFLAGVQKEANSTVFAYQ